MNINASLKVVNDNGIVDATSQGILSAIENPLERDWIDQALKVIKQMDKGGKSLKKMSWHINKLHAFKPDQIVNLIYYVNQEITKDPQSDGVRKYLNEQAAGLIIKEHPWYHSDLLEDLKMKDLAIQLVMERARLLTIDPCDALDELKRYEIDNRSAEGQKNIIEIAKAFAIHAGESISFHIRSFGIDATAPEGQQALIEIAKLAAKQNGEGTSKYIENYGFNASTKEGQQTLLEVAKIATQKCGLNILTYTKNYGIDPNTSSGQEALIELAKVAAQVDAKGTSQNIKYFGIDTTQPAGQKAMVDIAKLAAQHDGGGTSLWIKNYVINVTTPAGQKAMVEIAKLAAQNNGGETSRLIKNYGIKATTPEGQKELIEIAKLAADQNGGGTSEYIKNYDIAGNTEEGVFAKIEIAKRAAMQDGIISQHIKNYGLDSTNDLIQKALIEIAKLAAQKDGFSISENIYKYGINSRTPEGQRAMIEIAKLAAQNDGEATSYCILNYYIDSSTTEGQQALIDIAKLAAQQNGKGTSEYIDSYGINASTPQGQSAMIEIAMIAAYQNAYGTLTNINKYGINTTSKEGQQALIAIAKLAAEQVQGRTSDFIIYAAIDYNQPEGQQALIEIAKIAARKNGGVISRNIQSFNIDSATKEGLQGLIEIAKLAALNEGLETSFHIQKYGINPATPEGQRALIEIAKIAAKQNGAGTSKYIKYYAIDVTKPEGQEAMIEIAKLATQNNAKETLNCIENYRIQTDTDEEKLKFKELCNYIFICLIKQSDPFDYDSIVDKFIDYGKKINGNGTDTYKVDYILFYDQMEKLKKQKAKDVLEVCISKAASLLKVDSSHFNWVQNRVSNFQGEAEQIEFLKWWIGLVLVCTTREDLKQLFKENGPLFDKIYDLPVDMRKRFTCEVIGSLDAKNSVVAALKKEFSKDSFIHKMSVLPRDLRIAVTDLFVQACAGRQNELLHSLKLEAKELVYAQLTGFILSQFPVKGREVYLKVVKETLSDRNFRNSKYQKPLWECLIALHNSSLDDSSKIALLDKIFTKSLVPDRLNALKLTIDILNFKGEEYLKEVKDLKDLKSVVEQLFVDKCKIKIADFSTKYEGTIGHWRSKESLLTYAAKHVENKTVLPYFQAFLSSVLQGTFKESRYALHNNPHLAEIQKYHPEIFEKWKLNAELNEDEINTKSSEKPVSIESSIVKTLQQAVENRHLGLEQQESLFPNLSGCIGKWDQLQGALDDVMNKLKPLSGRKLLEEEIVQRDTLLLQKALFEIIKNPDDIKNKLNVLKGIKIKGLDSVLSPFYEDIKDAIKLIDSSDPSEQETYKVIDSDEPNDFILMGTEVLNSCQNVNGSASLNVGVLGYACDGKHRLVLVCDPSGKIVARSVLRLLIDAQGKPVIFQERMYVADANPEYPTLLRKLALKKAKALGVPLVVSPTDFEKEQAKPYPCAIKAKAKPVPFEYVDALKGLQNGPYQISQALHIEK